MSKLDLDIEKFNDDSFKLEIRTEDDKGVWSLVRFLSRQDVMKCKELFTDILKVERIDEEDITKLWSLAHHDGPCSMIVKYNNIYHYADLDDDQTPEGRPRKLFLYPLTDEEFNKENKRQELFRTYVGMHCDYDEKGKRQQNKGNIVASTQEELSKVYKEMDSIAPHPYRKAYRDRAPIGYFIL